MSATLTNLESRTTLLFSLSSLVPHPPLPFQTEVAGIEEELARVSPTLQRYAELTSGSRPSVSFAQDSPDASLPVQSFLSQMECEGEEIRVVPGPNADWTQLGRMKTRTHTHNTKTRTDTHTLLPISVLEVSLGVCVFPL